MYVLYLYVLYMFVLYMYVLYISFVMFGTILMATQERKYELGVLLAIGMRKRKTAAMMFIENIIMSIIGVIVGVLIVSPISYYFHYNPIILQGEQAEIIAEFGFDPIIPFSIDPMIALNHGLIVLTISILLFIYPAFAVKNLNPLEAMKR